MEKFFYLIREYWNDAILGFILLKLLHIGTKCVGFLIGRYIILELKAVEDRIVAKVIEQIEEKFKK